VIYILRIVLQGDYLDIRHILYLQLKNKLCGDYPFYHSYKCLDRDSHQLTNQDRCHSYHHLPSCLYKSSQKHICTLLFHASNPCTSCRHICSRKAKCRCQIRSSGHLYSLPSRHFRFQMRSLPCHEADL
jgi:hypothetical protein